MTRTTLAMALCVLLGLSACSGTKRTTANASPAPETTETGGPLGALSADCPAVPDLKRRATCVNVVVPIDRSNPGTGSASLMVMTLHADQSSGDPVVFVPGGPGEAAITEAAQLANHPISAEHDLILIDPRGAGYSTPSLRCNEFDEARATYFSNRQRKFDRDLASVRAAAVKCAARLRSTGVDLDRYGTVELADDLDYVRKTLGIDTWTMWSVSYGTRVAQQSLRAYPDSLTGVVLDSLAPMSELELRHKNLTAKVVESLDRLVRRCDQDAACVAVYPSLATDLLSLVDRYNTAPHKVTIKGETGSVDAYFSGSDFTFVIWNMLKSVETIPFVPALIAQLAGGDTTTFDTLIAPSLSGLIETDPVAFSDGLNYAVDCRDYGALLSSEDDPATLTNPGATSTFLLLNSGSLCQAFGVTSGPASFAARVTSNVPVLILIGGLDPATPAVSAQAASKTFLNATVVEFPTAGHDLNGTVPCARDITSRWISSRKLRDLSCIATTIRWVS